ncbi:MAG: efflux RND transporter periplasmic adaptor subunit, partial [Deltaproteobacteria bacterium]|nr:efflux RND transporter periplasmic adaptor subunit [Deltaproteobacteria bacterium]
MKIPSLLRKARPLSALAGVFVVGLVVGRCDYGRGSDTDSTGDREHQHDADTLYTCAMHPEVRLPQDGACPICGMDMIPVDDSKTQVIGNRISLTERARQLASIRTTEVTTRKSPGGALRLTGKIDYDETRVRSITSWISGRIERLRVAATGEVVRRGQVIAVVYSPEVYAAQSDLIQARKQVARLASADPAARRSAEAARDAARERLKLLGVGAGDLKKMEAAESPWRQVSIRAQSAGTVLHKRVDPGTYVQPGTELFQVADLGKVWVQIDAYESDLPRLRKGLSVELTSRSVPGETFRGTIEFIDPVVSPKTRTARVRVEVDNRAGKLRPGMFADASIETGQGGESLMVPASAVLFTGRRSVVYVEVPG